MCDAATFLTGIGTSLAVYSVLISSVKLATPSRRIVTLWIGAIIGFFAAIAFSAVGISRDAGTITANCMMIITMYLQLGCAGLSLVQRNMILLSNTYRFSTRIAVEGLIMVASLLAIIGNLKQLYWGVTMISYTRLYGGPWMYPMLLIPLISIIACAFHVKYVVTFTRSRVILPRIISISQVMINMMIWIAWGTLSVLGYFPASVGFMLSSLILSSELQITRVLNVPKQQVVVQDVEHFQRRTSRNSFNSPSDDID
jgi:hypothetical protein